MLLNAYIIYYACAQVLITNIKYIIVILVEEEKEDLVSLANLSCEKK